MQSFALFRDGVFDETRQFPTRPADIPHKNVAWYPVGSTVEGTPAGWTIVGDEAIQTVEPVVVPGPLREGSFREFMDLFDATEQAAIAGAAMSNVTVKLWYDRAMGGSIRLDHPDTAAGLAALVSASIITQATADRVLAARFDEGLI